MAPALRPDPGSFRDPESRVLTADGEIYRALSPEGAEDFEALERSGLLSDQRIVATERVKSHDMPAAVLTSDVAGLLRHERIPFVSYPYEWTFSMLKDAALVQLDLLLAALDHDLVLKDASPYNVQFRGAQPVFIDIGAFEQLRGDELWVGYRQFCMLYLFPLLLQALKDVGFQPWLRGSIDGISASDIRNLMSLRDHFRRGLLLNVFLQARLEQRESRSRDVIRREVRRAGAARELIVANVRKMRKLVARLDWQPARGLWTEYGEHNTYDERDAQAKDRFVADVCATRRRELTWDLGCNNGRHARIAAEHSDCVVAIDADPGPVELLYRSLRDEGNETILPLTLNLADPSPARGWRGRERGTLIERGQPELVLALALVHHLTIGANAPVREVVDWLAEIGGELVVEFPTRDDPMVAKMLAAKRAGLHRDYDRSEFERHLSSAFDIRRTEVLSAGTRLLYHVLPRGGVT